MASKAARAHVAAERAGVAATVSQTGETTLGAALDGEGVAHKSPSHARLTDRLAVVVITRNRRPEAIRAIGQLVALPERPRVILVDNASDDGTSPAVADAHPSVEVIRLERNLGGAARNIGVRAAGTPYVALSDDDSWWQPHSLENAVRMLDRHSSVAVVVGRTLVGAQEEDDPLNEELENSPLPADGGLPGPRVMGFLACAAVIRSSAFLEVGGFTPELMIGGEEELLACDLVGRGWDLVYVRDVVAHHHPSTVRSAGLRRRQGLRNSLWFLWLRRPLPSALRRTSQLARTIPRDLVSVRAFLDALRGLPWVLAARRVVPREVERQLLLLDEPQLKSRARRYVS